MIIPNQLLKISGREIKKIRELTSRIAFNIPLISQSGVNPFTNQFSNQCVSLAKKKDENLILAPTGTSNKGYYISISWAEYYNSSSFTFLSF